jgi:hypothetical protein
MKAWVIAASLAAALSLAPAAAQGDLTVINNPAEPQVNGTKAKLRDDPAVQGGKALRVDVRRKGANPWDISVESTIEQPVKAGDSLVFAFWARLEKGEDSAATGSLPYNAVQVSAAPYTTLFSAPVEIGPEWKLHEVRGKADADHAAGTLKATIHLASSAQTVDLGPLIVVNLGQE